MQQSESGNEKQNVEVLPVEHIIIQMQNMDRKERQTNVNIEALEFLQGLGSNVTCSLDLSAFCLLTYEYATCLHGWNVGMEQSRYSGLAAGSD